MSVVIETTLGVVTVDLFIAAREKICRNFLKLCKIKYYNFCLFHNVQAGFMAQSGDPTGTGRGGESVFGRLFGDQATYFEGESLPKIKHERKGMLSMVGVGNNMFGSQFFLTLDDNLDYLDPDHCVFGEVTEGFEVLDKLNAVISDDNHRPYQDIRITHTIILEDPFDDPDRLEIPPTSPVPGPEILESGRLGADEDLEDDPDLDPELISDLTAAKEAKAQATILEMIGDLPDADCAPPENVLFVCKLNPVTTDEDLEIIFSRFGKVVSCEVIKDRKTGDSLQYAFVEFDNPKSCETAYFKMDNVLIDDRRIHVDFSQSVSKFRWKGKGRLEEVEEEKEQRRPQQQQQQREEGKRNRSNRSPSPDGGRKKVDQRKENQRTRSRERRPSHDRKRSRSRSAERRRKSRDRKRSRSNSRSKTGGDRKWRKSRSRSPEKRRRSRSVEKRRSRSVEKRRRSRSSERQTSGLKRSRSRERKGRRY